MDFIDVERAHEGQDLLAHDLARHQDRESRRVGDDERGGDDLPPGVHRVFERSVQIEVVAILLIIGEVERGADVALGSHVVGAEPVVEPAEVGQGGADPPSGS